MSKMVIFPAVDESRLERIRGAAGAMRVVQPADDQAAREEMTDADAFFGKLTPELLRAAPRLRWVQSPTASLEHYLFPELIEHPLTLTNMRGIFSDVIADQVLGYVICFARNLHTYIRNQLSATWAPEGGEGARVAFATGPGHISEIDRRHQHLSDLTASTGSSWSESLQRDEGDAACIPWVPHNSGRQPATSGAGRPASAVSKGSTSSQLSVPAR
jgi:hypothetical protein